jgi:hypothetical protein
MDQTDIGLKAVVKALVDTVAPAIDPSDHLAKEQLRLAASYVDFVRQRLHLFHARERYDLRHYVGLADELLAAAAQDQSQPVVTLRSVLAEVKPLADDPAALTSDIRAAAMDLAHAVAAVVQAAHKDTGAGYARQVDKAVLAATEEKFELELLWYRPIGFDPSPRTDRSLEDYLK